MVVGGRAAVEVFFDNVFEADEWLQREYRGFRKSAVLVFEFNRADDIAKALVEFSNSFRIGDKFFVPMEVTNERWFLDEACNLIDKVKEFGGIIVEVHVTASKIASTDKELDDLFNVIRREIELWDFSRAMDSLPKERV